MHPINRIIYICFFFIPEFLLAQQVVNESIATPPKIIYQTAEFSSPHQKKLIDESRDTIVIDPGHGGEDTGAIGIKGIQEKEIMLNIATFLEEKLREKLRVKTVLTRARDKFVSLEERIKIANESKASLFVSLHSNAWQGQGKAEGFETFYLDNTNDRSSLRLADIENKSFANQKGESLEKNAKNDLNFIVSDLIQNAKLPESISLAHHINLSLFSLLKKNNPKITNRGVKKAPFFVLMGVQMPCTLAEVSFIDHPEEGKRLSKISYQKLIAEALYEGIKNYYEAVNSVKRKQNKSALNVKTSKRVNTKNTNTKIVNTKIK